MPRSCSNTAVGVLHSTSRSFSVDLQCIIIRTTDCGAAALFLGCPFNPLPQVLLNYRRWRVDQYTQIIKSITPETLSAFLPRLFDRLFLEALVVGNIPAQEAADIVTAAHRKMRAAWGAAAVWSG